MCKKGFISNVDFFVSFNIQNSDNGIPFVNKVKIMLIFAEKYSTNSSIHSYLIHNQLEQ